MDLVVYDDDDKRYVPWVVALSALLLVALVTAVLTFLVARQASGAEDTPLAGQSTPAPATSPSSTTPSTEPSAVPSSAAPTPSAAPPVAGPTPAPACEAALLQADAALRRAVAVDEALTQHTQIMDELLAERIDAEQALDQTLPVLTDGATERQRFQDELAAYTRSREGCPA